MGNASYLVGQDATQGYLEHILADDIVPKDGEQFAGSLDPAEIRRRLEGGGIYISFSIMDETGISVPNMTVSAIDLRLGRVCLGARI